MANEPSLENVDKFHSHFKKVGVHAHWDFWAQEPCEPTNSLTSVLEDYDFAMDGSLNKEILVGASIDAILSASASLHKRASNGDCNVLMRPVPAQHEFEMLLPRTYKGEKRDTSDDPDYRYKAPKEIESNVLVVKAMEYMDLSFGNFQALNYMHALHVRKVVQQKDVSIYGIVTDSLTWNFLYLDDHVQWSTRSYQWNGQACLIMSAIRRIFAGTESNKKLTVYRVYKPVDEKIDSSSD